MLVLYKAAPHHPLFVWANRAFTNRLVLHNPAFSPRSYQIDIFISLWFQGHFLVYNPNQLSQISALLIFTLGTCSYLMFRSVNSQKDKFKQSDGNCLIWGKKATYIPAEYLTSSGERKGSKLLTSGWWGVARHMNYTADLVGALCYGLACGSKEFIPFFYFVFLLILLVHRCLRDEDRCKAKYGKSWNVYTSKVKYRLIPYLF